MIEKIKSLTGKFYLLIEKYDGTIFLKSEEMGSGMEFKDRAEMHEVLDRMREVLPPINASVPKKKVDFQEFYG